MEDLNSILSSFETISLNEMESVALMNRTDTKFVFRSDQLPRFLKKIFHSYRILTVNNLFSSKYRTLYYDTVDFKMYLEHHRGKPSRYKIRHRIYADSQLQYFEIKYKNNKGRTIKNRIKRTELNNLISGKAEELLTKYTSFKADSLFPKLWSNCSRITLVNKFSKERLTLDVDLQFKNEESEKNLVNIEIAEVKQEKKTSSPFTKLMKEERIRQGSISKYCMGVASLYNHIKKNNFKQNILQINKINGYATQN
jgi:hypothetical protein